MSDSKPDSKSDSNTHPTWSSRPAFLMATVGAAVGLGNLWRFPFMAGENGGGAFVLVYIFFILLIGIPIIMAELCIGRRGRRSPIATMRALSAEAGRSRRWQLVGWLSIAIPFIGLSYYSVVAGWAIDYVAKAALGTFDGLSSGGSQDTFDRVLASPLRMLAVHTLFIAAAVFIVSRGIHSGIETMAKVMMPVLFLLLVVMVINAAVTADFSAGLRFLFAPDFSKLTPTVVFMALGQAFFSIAVGVGVLMTYGSYMPKNYPLPASATVIAAADTGVAILAGLAIFPLVFHYALDPGGGPGLIFVTLPIAFGQMPAGHLLGLLFFVLLFFAAFSTAIGMLEPVVSWFEGRGRGRPAVAFWCGAGAWFLGLAAMLSFNVWKDVRLLPAIAMVSDKSIFDLFDFLVSNLLLPINALLIALFAGWMMSRQATVDELGMGEGWRYGCWRAAIRYIAPVAIVLVFVTSLR